MVKRAAGTLDRSSTSSSEVPGLLTVLVDACGAAALSVLLLCQAEPLLVITRLVEDWKECKCRLCSSGSACKTLAFLAMTSRIVSSPAS